MRIRLLSTLVLFFCVCVSINAHGYSDSTIVEHLENSGKVTIKQPKGLETRMNENRPSSQESQQSTSSTESEHKSHQLTIQRIIGYRVQVFADNNPKTGKNEALVKERNIMARFPSVKTYLSYKAPMWRLRVGDFRSRNEASEFMHELKKVFPAYAREMIIVKDRVNVYM